MRIIEVIFIALGLAMDALAVSIVKGMVTREQRVANAFKIAISFGSFQALMPSLGWLTGHTLKAFISGFDHWIAFGLLSLIGGKMIYESFKIKPVENDPDTLSLLTLLLLSIATSIDAFIVGVSFAFLRVSILTSILLIGIVTFLLSFFGVLFGNKVGHFLGKRIEIIGGLILIGIGIRILVQHLA